MGRVIWALALVLSGTGPVAAQNWVSGAPDVPRFEQCLPEQMAAFEARLLGLPGYGVTVPVDAINVHWVQHCGYLAMGICNVSDAAFLCHRRLRDAFAVQAAALRAELPAPETVPGGLRPLYAQVLALAEGTNAGDDCDGATAYDYTWCAAFQAALKFEEAVWAWQVARLAGAAGPLDWDDWAGLE